DGKRLLVANGKGIISRSNRNGPAPGREAPASVKEYIAGLMQGTLEIIELPARERFLNQMKTYTARAYSCMPAVARTNAVVADEEMSLTSTNKDQSLLTSAATTDGKAAAKPWSNPIPRHLGEI